MFRLHLFILVIIVLLIKLFYLWIIHSLILSILSMQFLMNWLIIHFFIISINVHFLFSNFHELKFLFTPHKTYSIFLGFPIMLFWLRFKKFPFKVYSPSLIKSITIINFFNLFLCFLYQYSFYLLSNLLN